MTLYAVLGNGTMPEKEVFHQLDDLWKKAESEDQDFWFLMEGKANPTETDLALVDFFNKFQVHYVLLNVEGTKVSDEYTGVGEFVDVTDASGATIVEALSLLKASEEETPGGEDAVVLALFSDISGDSQEDAALIAQLTATITAGSKAFALNDSMEPIELRTEAEAELPEDVVKPKVEEVPTPTEDEPEEPLTIDKSYLSGLTAAELKDLAKGMGIPYTTKAEAIVAILAVQDTQQAGENWQAVIDTVVADTPVSEGADMADAESDFVEDDSEAKYDAADAEFGHGVVSPLPVPNMEDPLVKEDIRTSGVTKDKVHAYEVQYSYLPPAKNGQRTYRSNKKLLVLSTNIIRATALIMMKHQDEDIQVHQIVQRSHDKVMIDSAIFGED